MRRTKTFNDFFHGGGNVGPWMSAFSYGTAYFSAVVFIGFAGKVGWGFGYSGIWIGIFNGLIGVLGVWALMGWRIKKISSQYKVDTMSEFLEKRYHSPFIKLFASIAIFIFLVPYSAAVFIGLSYLFSFSFPGIQYWHTVVFMGVFTALYLVMGGYKSMAIVDVVFGIIMTAGVIILGALIVNKGGGFTHITEGINNINQGLTSVIGPPGWWQLFSLIVLTSVAPFAMPQLIQKFYAIRDKRSVYIGMIASTVFSLLIGIVAYYIGSTTQFFLNPENAPAAFLIDGTPNVDALMPVMLTKVIPDSLAIVVLLLILAASMSTLASLILISSSSLSKDFYAGFINKNISDRNLTLMMRVSNGFFVFLSVIIALIKPDTIVTILGISWGAIGSAFLGPFVLGLLWKGATRQGAITSMIIGLASCLGLYISGFSSPEAGTIGMGVSLAVNYLVSILTKPKTSVQS
jgi:SSS family solute:Na+ symporter/sodium/proline symporter